MSYVYLFTIFFRIGLFGFGGGVAMLPLIFQSVQTFGIMDTEEFSNLVALSQVTPGPIAVNAATYVGQAYAGFWGAAVATISVALPSFIIILVVMKFLEKYKESK
ncbi:MAG: chromate transporter, partial [Anaerovoracaceae bacterium]